jgi:hypothetical protein
MNYNVLLEAGQEGRADKLSRSHSYIKNDNNGKGLSALKKGQQITGTVISVEDLVTLNFSGQIVAAPKNVLSDATVGEMKTFEVVKATDTEVELKLISNFDKTNKKIFKTIKVKDADWESLMDKKEREAQKAEKDNQANSTKSQLDEIGTKMTAKDCQDLEEEGFSMGSYTIDGLKNALKRVKADGSNTIPKSVSGALDQAGIARRLLAENLPVTPENLSNITNALELAKTVPNLDDKAMKYLISNSAAPTAENIYKAYYSGNNQDAKTELTQQEWSSLKGQAEEVIKSAGYEVNEDNLKDAKWLIENNLPLTKDTFTYKKDLDTMKSELSSDEVLDKMVAGIKEGIQPKDVSLRTEETSAEKIVDGVQSISDEAIARAISEDKKLTIENLTKLQEKIETEANGKESIDKAVISETNNTYEEIKAKRQLEEIRLKMTLEAAAELEKKGFKIETQELEKVVNALKELEDNYYRNYFKEAGMQASELNVQLLKETTQSVESLKFIPCQALGSTLDIRSTQTIPGLLSEGSKLQADYGKAGEAYETMMTVPNSEYGDSIRKAFANMEPLLSELNIENTEQNQRAARILGYNQMTISQENIDKVKAYDLQVTNLIQKLHPAVTVRMIKDGINPLEMPINELNQTIDQIKEEQGITSEEKYSTYLRTLEKQNGISAEERKAYIGIYRLLYNVEKSDGAALGAVVKAGRDVTLDNLLTAVQTGKKGRFDTIINDEFGSLQSVTQDKNSMAQQLSLFNESAGQQNGGQADRDALEEQTEYNSRLLKQIMEEVTPENLQEAGQYLAAAGLNDTQIAALPLLSSGKGIWNSVKNVPIEKLLNQLRNVEAAQGMEDEAYQVKVNELQELCRNSEQAIRFLNDYQVPSTPANLMMVNHILSNGESPVVKLLKQKSENIDENTENSIKETDEVSDKLIDKSSMQDAYEKLDADAKALLTQVCSGEVIDSRRLAELKSLSQQITFMKTLAEKEFCM